MANFYASYPVLINGPGTGTVTSVGVLTDATTDSILANTSHEIPGSPVTTAGDMTLTLLTQAANTVLAGPTTGAAAAPTFRALVIADLPVLVKPTETDIGNAGTTQAINLSTGNFWTATLDQSSCTITFSNPVAGAPYAFRFTQGSGGSKTVTFAGVTVIWASGNSTLSTAAGAIDLVTMVYDNSLTKLLATLTTGYV